MAHHAVDLSREQKHVWLSLFQGKSWKEANREPLALHLILWIYNEQEKEDDNNRKKLDWEIIQGNMTESGEFDAIKSILQRYRISTQGEQQFSLIHE